MSVNAQVHLSSNENNKKSDKTFKPLFPKREECSHVSCYWQVKSLMRFECNFFKDNNLIKCLCCSIVQRGKRLETMSGCLIESTRGAG